MDNTEDKDILTQTTQEVSGATSQAPAEAPETTPAKPPRRRSRRPTDALRTILIHDVKSLTHRYVTNHPSR